MSTIPRLYIAASFAPNDLLACATPQAHYLRSVLRMADGAEVELFNGSQGSWRATLRHVGKKEAQFQLADAPRKAQQPVPDLWLLCAPLRQSRFDLLVEKATELGVSRIVPVLTKRCSVRQVNPDRLRSISIEAAEQCERDAIPEILPLQPLADALAGWDAARVLLVADETGQGKSAVDVLNGCHMPLAVAIGPEGGWAEDELQLLNRMGSVRKIGLGPRILRAETAAIAALSVVLSQCGDWENAPRFGQS